MDDLVGTGALGRARSPASPSDWTLSSAVSETIDGPVVGELSIRGFCTLGTGSGIGVDGSGESAAVAVFFFVSESGVGVGGRLGEGSRGGSSVVAAAGGEELAWEASSDGSVGRGIVESSR